MTHRSLAVLIILNALLIAAIATTFGATSQSAQAQGLGGGNYLMIAGDTSQNGQQAVIYIMDTGTGRVAAIQVNSANGRISPVGAREIGNDMRNGGGGQDR